MKLILGNHGPFEVTKNETSIGRGADNDWVIPNERLSRTHCIFYHDPQDRMAIMDPGSKNGVIVDGARIEQNKMVPVTATSIVMLANELYLSFDMALTPKPVTMARPPRSAGQKGPPSAKSSPENKGDLHKKAMLRKLAVVILTGVVALAAVIFSKR